MTPINRGTDTTEKETAMDLNTVLIEALAAARNTADEIGDPELISMTERALADAHMRLIQMRGFE